MVVGKESDRGYVKQREREREKKKFRVKVKVMCPKPMKKSQRNRCMSTTSDRRDVTSKQAKMMSNNNRTHERINIGLGWDCVP